MSRRKKRRLSKQQIRVIDAHNVCYQVSSLRQYMHNDPERARRAFEDMIGDQDRCHVFYDGGPGGEERRQHRGSLVIHYSGERSADDCIVEWLNYQNCNEITVISDDRHLQMRAKELGTRISTVVDFLNNLDEQKIQEPGIDEIPPSDTEIDFWKDQFGVND